MSRNTQAQSRETIPHSIDGTLPSCTHTPQGSAPELVRIRDLIKNQLPEDTHIVALVKTSTRIGIVVEQPHQSGAIGSSLSPGPLPLIQKEFPGYHIDFYSYAQGVACDFTSHLRTRMHALDGLKYSGSNQSEYTTVSQIGEKLWGGDAKSSTANSLLLDFTLGTLTIFEERVSNSVARMNRAILRYYDLLSDVIRGIDHGRAAGLSINVEVDHSMYDLQTQLKRFLEDRQITSFGIINDPQCLIVHVLHYSSDESYCERERSEIRTFVQGITPGAIKVEGVTGGQSQVNKLFAALPSDWRLSEVSISSDGQSARLTSSINTEKIWGEDVQTYMHSLFPGGVYLNSESFVELSATNPQYLTTLHTLPTRCELRAMRRCVVTGEIKLYVLQAPEESVLMGLSDSLSTTITTHIVPAIFAPYPIQEPLRFIGQYAQKIPFSTVPPEYLSMVHGRGGCLSIGGSCFSIRILGLHIVADFGARLQEGEKLELTDDIVKNSTFGIVTHLHTDHSGGLLEAYMQGYRKPILMTKTIALAMYPILKEQAMRNNIPIGVIEELYKLVVVVPCNVPLQVSENHTLTFYPSGHSLGSTSVRVEYTSPSENFSVLYTGDYKNGQSHLYNPAMIPPPSDVVISEGTYGMREVPSLAETSQLGIESIKSAVMEGATVICPVLSFDRAQEVLMMLDPYREWFDSHNIPIHIVGGIIEKNLIYGYVAKDQPQVLSERAHKTKPWRFSQHSSISKPGNSDYSPELLARGRGKLILVSGGMVVGHAGELVRRYQDDPTALLLLTCYQAEGTLGREILEYSEGLMEEIKSLPDFCMKVRRISFAGHSSGEQTLDYLTKAVKDNGTIVLVHGTEESLQEITDECRTRRIGGDVLMLKFGEDTTLRS